MPHTVTPRLVLRYTMQYESTRAHAGIGSERWPSSCGLPRSGRPRSGGPNPNPNPLALPLAPYIRWWCAVIRAQAQEPEPCSLRSAAPPPLTNYKKLTLTPIPLYHSGGARAGTAVARALRAAGRVDLQRLIAAVTSRRLPPCGGGDDGARARSRQEAALVYMS